MNRKVVSIILCLCMVLNILTPIMVFAATKPTIVATTVGSSGTTTLNTSNGYTLSDTQTITVKASPNVASIEYGFDTDATSIVYASSKTISIPSKYKDGNVHYLDVKAMSTDGTSSGWYTYTFKVVQQSSTKPSITATTYGSNGTITMNQSNSYILSESQTIKIVASPSGSIASIEYGFDADATSMIYASSKTISIPSKYKDGNVHYLDVKAMSTDGTSSGWYTYTFKVEVEMEDPTLTLRTNGTTMNTTKTYLLEIDQVLTITASHDSGIDRIEYGFDDDSTQALYNPSQGITIPAKYQDGNVHTMDIRVIAANGQASEWFTYKFRYNVVEEVQPDVTVTTVNSSNSTIIMNTNDKYIFRKNQTIKISAKHDSGISKIEYYFDNNSTKTINGSSTTLTIPDTCLDGNIHYLNIRVTSKDGNVAGWYVYQFKVSTDDSTSEKPIVYAITNGITMSTASKYIFSSTQKVELTATHDKGIKTIEYQFENDSIVYKSSSAVEISIPEKYTDSQIYYFKVRAQSTDGVYSDWQEYCFRVEDKSGNTQYTVIVQPDEVINKNVSGLAVSLRNISNVQGNKNRYMINENAQYNIDYTNLGAKITGEVTLTFSIPENVSIRFIDTKGGTMVDSKTLKWTFNGLEQGESGTIPVILAYTSIGSGNNIMVTPIAKLTTTSGVDTSAVQNMVYTANTTITTRHEPYMIGDAGTDTFRPNEGLNRAEMAMVLVRIFDIPLVTNQKVTYTDADVIATNPYRWATDAIMTVTKYGLMEGYEDGSFRPGDKVTKAQLTTVIARKFEVDNNSANNPFKIKEQPIKLSTVNQSQWYSKYVAQLTRLNMISNVNNIDSMVTRAETANIINSCLFRGPSVDGSNGTLTKRFSDVNANTQYYADILEASADMHNSRFTSNGYETIMK